MAGGMFRHKPWWKMHSAAPHHGERAWARWENPVQAMQWWQKVLPAEGRGGMRHVGTTYGPQSKVHGKGRG